MERKALDQWAPASAHLASLLTGPAMMEPAPASDDAASACPQPQSTKFTTRRYFSLNYYELTLHMSEPRAI
jgi:hypothetical protein